MQISKDVHTRIQKKISHHTIAWCEWAYPIWKVFCSQRYFPIPQMLKTTTFEYLPSQTKLRKGNVFTNVCQEFCPRGEVYTPRADPTLGRHTPRQTHTLHPGQTSPPPTPSDGHCRGRYASYWNAFLFKGKISHY